MHVQGGRSILSGAVSLWGFQVARFFPPIPYPLFSTDMGSKTEKSTRRYSSRAHVSGTYIKEFVHGDLGRTVPSVGSLLNCRADILQLDVTNVEDKWSADEAAAESFSPRKAEVFPPRAVSGGSGGDVEDRESSASEGRGAQ